jgi:hypothetical protein
MAATKPDKLAGPGASTGAHPFAASADKGAASQARSTTKSATFGAHVAAAATIDEILASEARASLRGRAQLRDEPIKSKPRISIPPARVVARPSQSQAWIKPFISLTVVVGVVTFLCACSLAYLFVRPLGVSNTSDAELRGLRDNVAVLRRNVAELASDVAASHAAAETASKTASDRAERLAQAYDRGGRDQTVTAPKTERVAEDRATTARTVPAQQPSDVTGTIQQAQRPAPAPRDIIAGWHVRRAYDGVAMLEGPNGVFEVGLGQDVSGLGRIQDIKYENNRWQVTTSKGIIPGR